MRRIFVQCGVSLVLGCGGVDPLPVELDPALDGAGIDGTVDRTVDDLEVCSFESGGVVSDLCANDALVPHAKSCK